MDLKLVDRRLHLRIFQKILEMVFEEIADADIPQLSLLLQLDQGLPCLVPDFPVFRAVDVVFRHSGPVNNQKIQVSNLQSFKDALTGLSGFFVSLLGWCNLAGDEYLAAIYLHFLQHLANHFFVLVDGCSVDVSVACLQGPPYALVALLFSQLVGPIADVRNLVA